MDDGVMVTTSSPAVHTPLTSSTTVTRRIPSNELPIYLLLVIRGLEFLVIEEIRASLQVEFLEIGSIEVDDNDSHRDIYQGEAATGRILLQTTSSAASVRALRSVQATLVLIAKSDHLITNDMKGVAQIEEIVVKANWAPAIALWKEHMLLCRVPTAFDPNVPPKFRASCVRDGTHAFKSIEIAAEMGGGINDLFAWPVDLVHPDLEVVCIVYYQHMVVGISLQDPTKSLFRNRFANEERNLLVDSRYMCTLRPSTAYLMLEIATYTKGDVLLDAMCGIGTIPIYSMAFAHPQLMVALGGDNDTEAVLKAGANAASELIQKHHYVGICQWDTTRLPVRDCCIDKAIIDLPFGIRCGTPREQRKLYPPMMKELFRVLRPGGRAVLLTTLRKTFQNALNAAPFQLTHVYDVSVGGVRGLIYVLDK